MKTGDCILADVAAPDSESVNTCHAFSFWTTSKKEGANPALALRYTRIHLLNYHQLAETQMDRLARQALKVHPGVSSPPVIDSFQTQG